MVKTALSGAGFASVGDALTYDYVVTNTGNITLTAPISISDDKIASVSCPSVGAGVTPGATLTCTATYLVTQADIDAGSVTNNATATVTQPVTGGPAAAGGDSPVAGAASAGLSPGLSSGASIGTPSGRGSTIAWSGDVNRCSDTCSPFAWSSLGRGPPRAARPVEVGQIEPGQRFRASFTVFGTDDDLNGIDRGMR